MKSTNIAAKAIAAVILSLPFLSMGQASAQLKFTMDSPSGYHISKYGTESTDPDTGKVTFKVKVRCTFLTIPADWNRLSSKQQSHQGKDLASRSVDEYLALPYTAFDGLGHIKIPNDAHSDVVASDTLYNDIRDTIPQILVDQIAWGARKSPTAQPSAWRGALPKEPAPDLKLAAFFGDFLFNERSMRRDAFQGTGYIDSSGFKDLLNDPKAAVRLVTSPDDASASTVEANDANLKKYGTWTYSTVMVELPSPVKTLEPPPSTIDKVAMFEEYAEWVLQLTVDPNDLPKDDLITAALEATSNPSADSQPNTTPDAKSTASSSGATFAGALLGGINIAGAGVGAPGLDIVGGPSVSDNGTQTMVGATFYPLMSRRHPDLTDNPLNGDHLAGLVGKQTQSGGGFIFGLGWRINPTVMPYVGGLFATSNGSTRSSTTFGIAIRIAGTDLGAQKGDATAKTKGSVKVDVVAKDAPQVASFLSTGATIMYYGDPNVFSADAKSGLHTGKAVYRSQSGKTDIQTIAFGDLRPRPDAKLADKTIPTTGNAFTNDSYTFLNWTQPGVLQEIRDNSNNVIWRPNSDDPQLAIKIDDGTGTLKDLSTTSPSFEKGKLYRLYVTRIKQP